jgi:putative phosphoesterase
MRIGVISDTHGYFDPKIPSLFEGVDHILHAGDIGSPTVTIHLEQVAPVTAVLGNNDTFSGFRDFELIVLAGFKFLIHHIVHPHAPTDELQERLELERPQVVVFGHTHKPFCERINDLFFFNPGYAGKQRFAVTRTIGILVCSRDQITPEVISL